MKSLLLSLIGLLGFISISYSQTEPGWARRMGGWEDLNTGLAVASDGTVYIAGKYQAPGDFSGLFPSTDSGQTHSFVATYDPSGSVLGVSSDTGSTLLNLPMIYSGQLIWNRTGTLCVFGDGSLRTLDATFHQTSEQHFIRLVSTEKNLLSARIAFDESNNALLAIVAVDTILIGDSMMIGHGTYSVFAKFTPDGRLLFSRLIDVPRNTMVRLHDIAEKNGYTYLTGYYGGDQFLPEFVDFGGDTLRLTPNHQEGFIVKYDQNGDCVWARRVGPIDNNGFNYCKGIALDSSGNIYTVGAAQYHFALTKFDQNGKLVWQARASGSGDSGGNLIAVSDSGEIYVSGNTALGERFDSVISIPQGDTSYLFVLKYGWNGQLLSSHIAAGDSYARIIPGQMTIDHNGIVYLSGQFEGRVGFEHDTVSEKDWRSNEDIFIWRLGKDTTKAQPMTRAVATSRARNDVAVYPNPFVSKLNMRLPDEPIIHMEFFNALGERVLSRTDNLQPQDNSLQRCDMSGFPVGIYTVRISGKDWTRSFKVVKALGY